MFIPIKDTIGTRWLVNVDHITAIRQSDMMPPQIRLSTGEAIDCHEESREVLRKYWERTGNTFPTRTVQI